MLSDFLMERITFSLAGNEAVSKVLAYAIGTSAPDVLYMGASK